MKKKNMFYTLIVVTALVLITAWPQIRAAENKKEAPIQVLFTNVNIFDGFSDKLQENMSVLV